MKLFLLLAGLAAAMGACPNACSGHGTCGLSSKCTCQARWVGNDCSKRQCPSGLSWIVGASNTNVPAGGTLGGYHPYAECSDRGICDRDSGECQCFEGYAGRGCRRTACPNACSGHGLCRYNYEVNKDYAGYGAGSSSRRYDTEQWDAAKTRQCVCDRGYEGTDCSSRICPKGDDPLTKCNNGNGIVGEAPHPGESLNDVQQIEFFGGGSCVETATVSDATDKAACEAVTLTNLFTAASCEAVQKDAGGGAACTYTSFYGPDNFFALTFKDMYNGEYITRPIHTDVATTDATKLIAWAKEVKDALEELPNFAIPNVTVTAEWKSVDPKMYLVSVAFVDPANAGEQNKLVVSNLDNEHNMAGCQPRFVKVGGGKDNVAVKHKYTSATPGSNQVALGSNKLEERSECSNRGSCDGDTGLCQCFEGFTGEACHQQTVFF